MLSTRNPNVIGAYPQQQHAASSSLDVPAPLLSSSSRGPNHHTINLFPAATDTASSLSSPPIMQHDYSSALIPTRMTSAASMVADVEEASTSLASASSHQRDEMKRNLWELFKQHSHFEYDVTQHHDDESGGHHGGDIVSPQRISRVQQHQQQQQQRPTSSFALPTTIKFPSSSAASASPSPRRAHSSSFVTAANGGGTASASTAATSASVSTASSLSSVSVNRRMTKGEFLSMVKTLRQDPTLMGVATTSPLIEGGGDKENQHTSATTYATISLAAASGGKAKMKSALPHHNTTSTAATTAPTFSTQLSEVDLLLSSDTYAGQVWDRLMNGSGNTSKGGGRGGGGASNASWARVSKALLSMLMTAGGGSGGGSDGGAFGYPSVRALPPTATATSTHRQAHDTSAPPRLVATKVVAKRSGSSTSSANTSTSRPRGGEQHFSPSPDPVWESPYKPAAVGEDAVAMEEEGNGHVGSSTYSAEAVVVAQRSSSSSSTRQASDGDRDAVGELPAAPQAPRAAAADDGSSSPTVVVRDAFASMIAAHLPARKKGGRGDTVTTAGQRTPSSSTAEAYSGRAASSSSGGGGGSVAAAILGASSRGASSSKANATAAAVPPPTRRLLAGSTAKPTVASPSPSVLSSAARAQRSTTRASSRSMGSAATTATISASQPPSPAQQRRGGGGGVNSLARERSLAGEGEASRTARQESTTSTAGAAARLPMPQYFEEEEELPTSTAVVTAAAVADDDHAQQQHPRHHRFAVRTRSQSHREEPIEEAPRQYNAAPSQPFFASHHSDNAEDSCCDDDNDVPVVAITLGGGGGGGAVSLPPSRSEEAPSTAAVSGAAVDAMTTDGTVAMADRAIGDADDEATLYEGMESVSVPRRAGGGVGEGAGADMTDDAPTTTQQRMSVCLDSSPLPTTVFNGTQQSNQSLQGGEGAEGGGAGPLTVADDSIVVVLAETPARPPNPLLTPQPMAAVVMGTPAKAHRGAAGEWEGREEGEEEEIILSPSPAKKLPFTSSGDRDGALVAETLRDVSAPVAPTRTPTPSTPTVTAAPVAAPPAASTSAAAVGLLTNGASFAALLYKDRYARRDDGGDGKGEGTHLGAPPPLASSRLAPGQRAAADGAAMGQPQQQIHRYFRDPAAATTSSAAAVMAGPSPSAFSPSPQRRDTRSITMMMSPSPLHQQKQQHMYYSPLAPSPQGEGRGASIRINLDDDDSSDDGADRDVGMGVQQQRAAHMSPHRAPPLASSSSALAASPHPYYQEKEKDPQSSSQYWARPSPSRHALAEGASTTTRSTSAAMAGGAESHHHHNSRVRDVYREESAPVPSSSPPPPFVREASPPMANIIPRGGGGDGATVNRSLSRALLMSPQYSEPAATAAVGGGGGPVDKAGNTSSPNHDDDAVVSGEGMEMDVSVLGAPSPLPLRSGSSGRQGAHAVLADIPAYRRSASCPSPSCSRGESSSTQQSSTRSAPSAAGGGAIRAASVASYAPYDLYYPSTHRRTTHTGTAAAVLNRRAHPVAAQQGHGGALPVTASVRSRSSPPMPTTTARFSLVTGGGGGGSVAVANDHYAEDDDSDGDAEEGGLRGRSIHRHYQRPVAAQIHHHSVGAARRNSNNDDPQRQNMYNHRQRSASSASSSSATCSYCSCASCEEAEEERRRRRRNMNRGGRDQHSLSSSAADSFDSSDTCSFTCTEEAMSPPRSGSRSRSRAQPSASPAGSGRARRRDPLDATQRYYREEADSQSPPRGASGANTNERRHRQVPSHNASAQQQQQRTEATDERPPSHPLLAPPRRREIQMPQMPTAEQHAAVVTPSAGTEHRYNHNASVSSPQVDGSGSSQRSRSASQTRRGQLSCPPLLLEELRLAAAGRRPSSQTAIIANNNAGHNDTSVGPAQSAAVQSAIVINPLPTANRSAPRMAAVPSFGLQFADQPLPSAAVDGSGSSAAPPPLRTISGRHHLLAPPPPPPLPLAPSVGGWKAQKAAAAGTIAAPRSASADIASRRPTLRQCKPEMDVLPSGACGEVTDADNINTNAANTNTNTRSASNGIMVVRTAPSSRANSATRSMSGGSGITSVGLAGVVGPASGKGRVRTVTFMKSPSPLPSHNKNRHRDHDDDAHPATINAAMGSSGHPPSTSGSTTDDVGFTTARQIDYATMMASPLSGGRSSSSSSYSRRVGASTNAAADEVNPLTAPPPRSSATTSSTLSSAVAPMTAVQMTEAERWRMARHSNNSSVDGDGNDAPLLTGPHGGRGRYNLPSTAPPTPQRPPIIDRSSDEQPQHQQNQVTAPPPAVVSSAVPSPVRLNETLRPDDGDGDGEGSTAVMAARDAAAAAVDFAESDVRRSVSPASVTLATTQQPARVLASPPVVGGGGLAVAHQRRHSISPPFTSTNTSPLLDERSPPQGVGSGHSTSADDGHLGAIEAFINTALVLQQQQHTADGHAGRVSSTSLLRSFSEEARTAIAASVSMTSSAYASLSMGRELKSASMSGPTDAYVDYMSAATHAVSSTSAGPHAASDHGGSGSNSHYHPYGYGGALGVSRAVGVRVGAPTLLAPPPPLRVPLVVSASADLPQQSPPTSNGADGGAAMPPTSRSLSQHYDPTSPNGGADVGDHHATAAASFVEAFSRSTTTIRGAEGRLGSEESVGTIVTKDGGRGDLFASFLSHAATAKMMPAAVHTLVREPLRVPTSRPLPSSAAPFSSTSAAVTAKATVSYDDEGDEDATSTSASSSGGSSPTATSHSSASTTSQSSSPTGSSSSSASASATSSSPSGGFVYEYTSPFRRTSEANALPRQEQHGAVGGTAALASPPLVIESPAPAGVPNNASHSHTSGQQQQQQQQSSSSSAGAPTRVLTPRCVAPPNLSSRILKQVAEGNTPQKRRDSSMHEGSASGSGGGLLFASSSIYQPIVPKTRPAPPTASPFGGARPGNVNVNGTPRTPTVMSGSGGARRVVVPFAVGREGSASTSRASSVDSNASARSVVRTPPTSRVVVSRGGQ